MEEVKACGGVSQRDDSQHFSHGSDAAALLTGVDVVRHELGVVHGVIAVCITETAWIRRVGTRWEG